MDEKTVPIKFKGSEEIETYKTFKMWLSVNEMTFQKYVKDTMNETLKQANFCGEELRRRYATA